MADNSDKFHNYLVMDRQELLKYVDNLLFSQTGQHLDDLQSSILRGVLENQKYKQIAEQCYCTEGHVKDEAYELWKKLSETLGEDVNKANFRATIERIVITNSASTVYGSQIGSINLCPNCASSVPLSNLGKVEKNNDLTEEDSFDTIESVQRKIKLEVIPNLVKLGLTHEQIAQALGLSEDEVSQLLQQS